MKSISRFDEDGALTDALARIMGHLRGTPYGRFQGEAEGVLHREADRFVERLAGHLQFAEGTVFPALREVSPGLSGDFDEFEKDHRLFHLHARELGLGILGRDKKGAYGVARTLLAALLDHIHRETRVVDRFLQSQDVSSTGSLSRALIARRLPAPPAGGFSNSQGPT